MPFSKKQWELLILMDGVFWVALSIYLVDSMVYRIIFAAIFLIGLMFPILKIRMILDNVSMWVICINLLSEHAIYWNFAYCFMVLLFAITNNVEVKSRFLNYYNYFGFFAMTLYSITKVTELKTQVIIFTTTISVSLGLKLISPLIMYFKKVVDDQHLIACVYLDIGKKFAKMVIPKLHHSNVVTLKFCCDLNEIVIPSTWIPIKGDHIQLIYDLGIIKNCIANAEFSLNLDSKYFIVNGKTHEVGHIIMEAISEKKENYYIYDLKEYI